MPSSARTMPVLDHDPTTSPIPVSYDVCRRRFTEAAARTGLAVVSHPIDEVGPDGEQLTVDVVALGPRRPRRALLVLTGVHGVEGAPWSAALTQLLGRLPALADDDALVLVHGVNPWGMAWWRRQNEHNVDLNRNWAAAPGRLGNDAYAELHDLLCPTDPVLPDGDRFLRDLVAVGEQRGLPWVRRAISSGQDTHPDGLYHAGGTEQPSTAILREITDARLLGAEELFVLDLHTGHGAFGTATVLTRSPAGSPEERWLRATFAGTDLEVSGDGTDGQVVSKGGQLRLGIEDVVGAPVSRSATFELGTRSETTMIIAERAEHWVHRFGDRADPTHAEVIEHHLRCSVPDDPAWQAGALRLGGDALGRAIHRTFAPAR